MNDYKDLAIEQYEEMINENCEEEKFSEELDEFIECQIEELKFSEERKQELLELLLNEINFQIQSDKPNLIKLKEMINR